MSAASSPRLHIPYASPMSQLSSTRMRGPRPTLSGVVEALDADDRAQDSRHRRVHEGAAHGVVAERVPERGHDHALVERQVAVGDSAGGHVDAVVEAPAAVEAGEP